MWTEHVHWLHRLNQVWKKTCGRVIYEDTWFRAIRLLRAYVRIHPDLCKRDYCLVVVVAFWVALKVDDDEIEYSIVYIMEIINRSTDHTATRNELLTIEREMYRIFDYRLPMEPMVTTYLHHLCLHPHVEHACLTSLVRALIDGDPSVVDAPPEIQALKALSEYCLWHDTPFQPVTTFGYIINND